MPSFLIWDCCLLGLVRRWESFSQIVPALSRAGHSPNRPKNLQRKSGVLLNPHNHSEDQVALKISPLPTTKTSLTPRSSDQQATSNGPCHALLPCCLFDCCRTTSSEESNPAEEEGSLTLPNAPHVKIEDIQYDPAPAPHDSSRSLVRQPCYLSKPQQSLMLQYFSDAMWMGSANDLW